MTIFGSEMDGRTPFRVLDVSLRGVREEELLKLSDLPLRGQLKIQWKKPCRYNCSVIDRGSLKTLLGIPPLGVNRDNLQLALSL